MNKLYEMVRKVARGSFQGAKAYVGKDESTINEALREAGDYGRFVLFLDLFRLWLEQSEETHHAFSWEYTYHKKNGLGTELFYSLTADCRQLRIWTKRPEVEKARPEHVDSSMLGGCMLFEVVGKPETLDQYLEGILKIKPLQRKWIRENGISFYE
jgi:hypothetical protein